MSDLEKHIPNTDREILLPDGVYISNPAGYDPGGDGRAALYGRAILYRLGTWEVRVQCGDTDALSAVRMFRCGQFSPGAA